MSNRFSAQEILLGSGILTATGNNLYLNGVLISGQNGDYVLRSESGQFYASSNPSGFVTGVDNIGNGSGLFSGILNNKLEFKTIVGGSGIQVSGNNSNNLLTILVTGISSSNNSSSYDPYTARYYI